MLDSKELKKRSRQGAMISIFGFLIVISAMAYASVELTELNQEIEEKRVVADSLQTKINELTDSNLNVRVDAEPLEISGRELFDVTIWLSSSYLTLFKIDRVEYSFKHDSFINKERASDNIEKAFLVSYWGWGCETDLTVSIFYKDGTTDQIKINTCDKLEEAGFDLEEYQMSRK